MTGLYVRSHWHGAGAPVQVAHGLDPAMVEAVADRLTTCSFCAPGRARGYAVGTCYYAAPTLRPRGVRLRADAGGWGRSDLLDFIEAAW